MNTAIFKRKNTGELNNYFIETYLYNGFMKRYFKDFIFFFFFFFLLSDILENFSTLLIGDFINSIRNIQCPTAVFTHVLCKK